MIFFTRRIIDEVKVRLLKGNRPNVVRAMGCKDNPILSWSKIVKTNSGEKMRLELFTRRERFDFLDQSNFVVQAFKPQGNLPSISRRERPWNFLTRENTVPIGHVSCNKSGVDPESLLGWLAIIRSQPPPLLSTIHFNQTLIHGMTLYFRGTF